MTCYICGEDITWLLHYWVPEEGGNEPMCESCYQMSVDAQLKEVEKDG